MKQAQAKKRKSIIPGFGMSMGVTVAMLSLIILIPLASVLAYSFRLSPGEFAELMTRPNVVQSFVTSIGCALFAAVINCVFGVILAWVLVRYEFPGKRLMDGMIELPFALPTAVAGITLAKMYSDSGVLGRAFESIGIEIAYTKTGIVIAMIFIGIPFVVRAIQPVLETLSPSYEEAAYMLGASRLTVFWKIIFPEIRPALLTGFGDDTSGLNADESLFTKCGNIFLNGVNAHTNCTANGFVAGITLISFAVFAVEQIRVDGNFSRR